MKKSEVYFFFMQAFLKFKSELWRHIPQVTFATENIARKCNELMDESNDVIVRVDLGVFDDKDRFQTQITQRHFHDIINRLELCNRWLPRTSQSWSLKYKPRSFFLGIWLVLILMSASIPVSNPDTPNEWDEPIIIDDERVSFWPASSQNVWLLDRNLDSPAVVTVLHQRVPATFCPWLVDYSTSFIVETLHIDEARLEETAIRLGLNPDDFRLEKINSESQHRYKNSDQSIDVSLVVSKRKIITDFPFENTVVGELITAYQVDWGGELRVITITQIGNSNSNDPWAEEIILEWLDSRVDSN